MLSWGRQKERVAYIPGQVVAWRCKTGVSIREIKVGKNLDRDFFVDFQDRIIVKRMHRLYFPIHTGNSWHDFAVKSANGATTAKQEVHHDDDDGNTTTTTTTSTTRWSAKIMAAQKYDNVTGFFFLSNNHRRGAHHVCMCLGVSGGTTEKKMVRTPTICSLYRVSRSNNKNGGSFFWTGRN